MPDITPKPLRSKGNAIINLMGALGGVIYLGVAAVMYPNSKVEGLAHVNYQPLFMVVSAIMFVAIAVLFLTIKEPKLVAEQQKARGAASRVEPRRGRRQRQRDPAQARKEEPHIPPFVDQPVVSRL